MSTLPDGRGRCDNCGHEEENAGIVHFLMVADLDPAREGYIENLHFCRTGQGKCAKRIRRAAVLVDYTERKTDNAADSPKDG